jgi:hypothetical protein
MMEINNLKHIFDVLIIEEIDSPSVTSGLQYFSILNS